MKKIIFILITSCIFLHSCSPSRGDVVTVTRLYFNNSTIHVIKLVPYKNGIVITDSVKVFLPNTITLLESQKYKMLTPDSETFDFRYQRNTDSILVVFDDIKKEKHRNVQSIPIESTYLPNNERSIYFNYVGVYQSKIIEQRKNYIEIEFTYTFTEQDYLDAEVIK